jgi:hypothetical protein
MQKTKAGTVCHARARDDAIGVGMASVQSYRELIPVQFTEEIEVFAASLMLFYCA